MDQDSEIIFKDSFDEIVLKDNFKDVIFKDSFDSITFDLITGNRGIGFMQIEFDNIVG